MKTSELSGLLLVGTVAGDSLVATGAAAYSYVATRDLEISKIKALIIGTVTATTTAPRARFSKQPVYGSSAGSTHLGTLVISTGMTAGDMVMKDIDPVEFKAGEQLVINVLIGAAGGSADGTAIWMAEDNVAPQGILNSGYVYNSTLAVYKREL